MKGFGVKREKQNSCEAEWLGNVWTCVQDEEGTSKALL